MERLYLTERLINADELIKHLDYVSTGSGLWSNILNDVIEDCKEFVNHEPTVDAVPVVRCRDCRYFDNHYNNNYDNHIGNCMQCNRFVGDNGYCSFGERKDGDSGGKAD